MTTRIHRGTLIVGPIVLSACLPSATGQPFYEAYYLYLDNYPSHRNTGWHENVQGIAHDDNHWFITQTDTIWKIPVGHDLNVSPSGAPGVVQRTLGDYPALSAYNHLGDIVHFEYGGIGYLVVPLEGQGVVPAITVLLSSDLAYVHHASLREQVKCGWCAVDPSGYLYSSEGQPTALLRY